MFPLYSQQLFPDRPILPVRRRSDGFDVPDLDRRSSEKYSGRSPRQHDHPGDRFVFIPADCSLTGSNLLLRCPLYEKSTCHYQIKITTDGGGYLRKHKTLQQITNSFAFNANIYKHQGY
jgi:hypothetical protein